MQLVGSLSYNSEDTLLSAENEFNIVSIGVVGGLTVVKFLISGQPVAFLTVGGAGVGINGADGRFKWT